ncbi:hypothetical protein PTKIN_Ptkin15bG0178600 [Pterospermum kingtungense]
MVPVLDNKRLNVIFSPSPNSVAFVNGIEVVSIPDNLYGGNKENSLPFVNNINIPFDVPITTAFETAYRLNIGGGDMANVDDTGMFRTWQDDSSYINGAAMGVTPHRSTAAITYTQKTPAYTAPAIVYSTSRTMGRDPEINMNYYLTWIFPVDSGFSYLFRLHFCETLLEVTKVGQREFDIYINNQTADVDVDVIYLSGGNSKPIYRDYVVLIPNGPGQSEQDLWLALHPVSKQAGTMFDDAILNGLEIFRLNKSDGSLAVPNPEPNLSLTGNQGSPVSKRKTLKFSLPTIIGAVLGSGATVSICVLFPIIFRRQKRIRYNKRKSMERTKASPLPDSLCQCFTLAEIQAATSNSFVIGRGGFGNVYKGFIEGIEFAVAIKRLNSQSQQGAREFRTEIELLSQLRYIHLVSLIGYCNENDEKILVYDYMANRTLRDHLYKTDKIPLSWKHRLQICIGAARGLDYLHSSAIHRIIHRDVKSTNIC